MTSPKPSRKKIEGEGDSIMKFKDLLIKNKSYVVKQKVGKNACFVIQGLTTNSMRYDFDINNVSSYLARVIVDDEVVEDLRGLESTEQIYGELEKHKISYDILDAYGENAILINAHIGSCRLLKALGIVIKPTDVIRVDLIEKTAHKGSTDLTKYVDIDELENSLLGKSQSLNILWRLMNEKYEEHLNNRGINMEKSLKAWKEYNVLKSCLHYLN